MFILKWLKREPPASPEPIADPGDVTDEELLLLDRGSQYLGHGQSKDSLDSHNVQLKILRGNTDKVVAAEIIQVISPRENGPALMGRVIFRRGNSVVLEPLRKLGSEVRRNFRMNMDFQSFLYPAPTLRARFQCVDLSCGGIAFTTPYEFHPHEVTQVLIPCTIEAPLLLDVEVLREIRQEEELYTYGAKFVDLIHEQEAMLTEAVFAAQLESAREKTAREKAKKGNGKV